MDSSQNISGTQICDAMIALVTQRCREVSIERVATELGVPSKKVLDEMPSIDDILAKAFVLFVRRSFTGVALEVAGDEPPSKVLRGYADWLYGKLETLECFYTLLADHQIQVATLNQHFEHSPSMLITAMLTDFFEMLSAQTSIPSEDVRVTADSFYASVGHHARLSMRASDFRGHAPKTAYLNEVCQRLLRSRYAPKATSDALPLEIERKYLLSAMPTLTGLDVKRAWTIEQGYIPGQSITERIRRAVSRDWVKCTRTVKLGAGVSRIEFEDEIDPELFEQLWGATQGQRVTKERFVVSTPSGTWELDRFTDRQLVLLEIELSSENEAVHMPDAFKAVLVHEVTDDKKFTNWALSRNNVASSESD